MSNHRVAIWSGKSLENVGDQLIANVTEQELSRRIPRIEVQHFCPWSLREQEILWIDSNGSWPGLGHFDSVVIGGGGIFSGPPFRHPLMMAFCLGEVPKAFDPSGKVAWHGVGLQNGTSSMADSTSEQGQLERKYLREFSERATYVAVRDAGSIARFSDAGIAGVERIPDPTFALCPVKAVKASNRRRPRIGFMIGAPGYPTELLSRLIDPKIAGKWKWNSTLCLPPEVTAQLVQTSSPANFPALFFAGVCAGIEKLKSHFDTEIVLVENMYGDGRTALSLARACPPTPVKRLSIDSLADPSDISFCRALADYDLLVCSRFHSLILSMRSGVRVVAADPYLTRCDAETKVSDLLKSIDLTNRLWRPGISELADIIIQTLDEKPDDLARYCVEHQMAHDSFDRLVRLLDAA